MKDMTSIGDIMIAYDLKTDLGNSYFNPQTKYGIVISLKPWLNNEPYMVEWDDGTTSTHPQWEMDIMQKHTNLIFNNNCAAI